ncbi:MAG: aminotransferase class IV [Firmicutes bacterium]|nr:aminotransferase class IV [Bacillota bacterium]
MNYRIEENKSITEYNNSLFETFLIEDGHTYFLDEHLSRLNIASNDLFNSSIDIDNIKSFIRDNVPKLGKHGGRLVWDSKGCILSFRDVEYKGSGFLDISKIIRNSKDVKYFYKTNDYLERLEELKKVRESGFLDTIYLNEKGFVTSCSIANIYFIKGGVIHTPALKNGVLNGILREVIFKKCDCIEGNYHIEDFINSDGIFISNSLIELLRIEGIKDKRISFDQVSFDKIKKLYLLEKELDRRKCFG